MIILKISPPLEFEKVISKRGPSKGLEKKIISRFYSIYVYTVIKAS